MPINVFVTGGTFDKEYDIINGRLFFKDTHLPEIIKLGRCTLDVNIRTLMMIDSLEMTEEDRERVFERFYRAQGTRSIAGTGLGLSIARALAQWHGGSLTVCNAEGGGALFTLVLPLPAEP